MPTYDYICTIRIEGTDEDDAYAKYLDTTKHLDIYLSEAEEVE
jgi:hypothetical protein